MIHDNYNRLTDSERKFVDETTKRIMQKFRTDSFLPYALLGDDRAEYFVEAFATWLTESAKSHGLIRDAIGVQPDCQAELVVKKRLLSDEELVWGLQVA